MADKPKSIQEKITIRPTPVGARVIQRLSIPHMDKSGELRRLVELGFAAELAGFSLDGETLRFGGRVWDLRPELEQGAIAASNASVSEKAGTPTPVAIEDSRSAPQATTRGAAPETVPARAPDNAGRVEASAPPESPLLANLRGLSAGG